jgi:hypothetical protein
MEDQTVNTSNQLGNLRLWLASASVDQLGEFVSAIRDEASSRLAFDAANYMTRALACLDVARLAQRLAPATTEPIERE